MLAGGQPWGCAGDDLVASSLPVRLPWLGPPPAGLVFVIARIRAFLRSLQVDLAEREAAIAVGRWRLLTHADELIHDRHCPLTGYEPGDPARCECGWAEASPALEVLSDLAERVDGFGRAEARA